MLTEYILSALQRVTYEILDDRTFYAEVPGLQGLYANAPTLEACREELKELLEEWIVLSLQLGYTLPILEPTMECPQLGFFEVGVHSWQEGKHNKIAESRLRRS